MHQIQVADDVYEQAKRRADAGGYATVDEYIVNLLAGDDVGEQPNMNCFFTADHIAELDQISAAVKAGEKTFSSDEVDEHFRKKYETWPVSRAS